MEGDFEFIRDLTPRQDHPFGDSLIQSAFFCWEGIVINYDESAWFYPVVGDSMSVHNFERPGRIAAVSHDKKMAYYTLGWKADQESYLFDVPIKASRCISTDYMIDACFSPDGRYLALSEITYNLMDDIKLYIYDIGEDEIIFTGVRNGSGLGAWISGVDK
jgi:WD40 repeat protein